MPKSQTPAPSLAELLDGARARLSALDAEAAALRAFLKRARGAPGGARNGDRPAAAPPARPKFSKAARAKLAAAMRRRWKERRSEMLAAVAKGGRGRRSSKRRQAAKEAP